MRKKSDFSQQGQKVITLAEQGLIALYRQKAERSSELRGIFQGVLAEDAAGQVDTHSAHCQLALSVWVVGKQAARKGRLAQYTTDLQAELDAADADARFGSTETGRLVNRAYRLLWIMVLATAFREGRFQLQPGGEYDR